MTAGYGYRLAKGQELPLTLKASIALYAAAKIGANCSVLEQKRSADDEAWHQPVR